MKKFICGAIILFIILFSMPIKGMSEDNSSSMDVKVIPDEAIRLRILANSDKPADQAVKRMVRDEVSNVISKWVKDITDINEARRMIEARIPEIKQIVDGVLKRENEQPIYDVKYGKKISFPAKLYGDYLYPAGKYEAVLITLGKGKGANWWCVLFPPLCFLDFSNGTSVAEAAPEKEQEELKEKEEPVEVKFFLFEWFDWL
ncbi:stage II sporulation protein R [Virgibacillus siamensis]|uniref:stage II sporulation protein R n=1 Tax=Virgibacillus siamensis TaxID=480071 RepID=UPI000984F258|nr:stage II sporulation protein R [Virgibacillus siamensis]